MSPESKKKALVCLLMLSGLVSVFAPKWLARYQDRFMLNEITVEEAKGLNEGYRYTLSSNEKLYLLGECLARQVLPESEQSAQLRMEAQDVEYENLMGTYAFVVNRQGPTGEELTREEIFAVCSRELAALKERKILPESVRDVDESSYSAELYSAIDVLEPQNNMAVWKVSLFTSHKNTDKADRLIDAYIDADSGKTYSFYVRTEWDWSDIEPEKLIKEWETYLGLFGREAYQSDNPLLETTPDFVKYSYPGMGEGKTVVTLGFFEGIRELFLKLD